MMDHLCLRGPHPQPPLPPAPAAAAAAPPPLLYSSWLIIQASQQGVFASCPRPTHCQPSPSPCPEGQNRPPKPEQGLTKHFLSASLPHRASLQTPSGPNMDPHKYLTHSPNLLLLLPLSSITLR